MMFTNNQGNATKSGRGMKRGQPRPLLASPPLVTVPPSPTAICVIHGGTLVKSQQNVFQFPVGNRMNDAMNDLEERGFQTELVRGLNKMRVYPPAGSTTSEKRMLWCQEWEESERGWGVKPDGYSLHPSLEALERYHDKYVRSLPDEVPDEYSRKSGDPFICEIYTDDLRLKDLGDGKKFWGQKNMPKPKKNVPDLLTSEEWRLLLLGRKTEFENLVRTRLPIGPSVVKRVIESLETVLCLLPEENNEKQSRK